MNISCEEYSEKLSQLMDGTITEEEWMAYCKEILEEIMDENKDVYIRMKERGDSCTSMDS
jgi:hypothetical protein